MNQQGALRSIKWIVILFLLGVAFFLWPRKKRYPPGVLISSSPELVALEDGKSWTVTRLSAAPGLIAS